MCEREERGERKERLDLLLGTLEYGVVASQARLQRCKMMKMMMMVKKMYLKMCSRPFFTLVSGGG